MSSHGPFDSKTGGVVGKTIEAHTVQCLANIAVIVAAERSSLASAVSATIILGDETDFAGGNEVWGKTLPVDSFARRLA